MRGLLLIITRREANCGVAYVIYVKLRSGSETDERDGETYERVGLVYLSFDAKDEEIGMDEIEVCFDAKDEEIEMDEIEEDEEYDSEEDEKDDNLEECHSDISLWDREPWNAFPLMEVTLV